MDDKLGGVGNFANVEQFHYELLRGALHIWSDFLNQISLSLSFTTEWFG